MCVYALSATVHLFTYAKESQGTILPLSISYIDKNVRAYNVYLLLYT